MYETLDIHDKYCWFMCQNCGGGVLAHEATDHTLLDCVNCDEPDWLPSQPYAFIGKPLKFSKKLQLLPEMYCVSWKEGASPARIALYKTGGSSFLRPVVGGPDTSYDTAKAVEDLGGDVPDLEELERLFFYYPKYKDQVHRAGILQGLLAGNSHSAMLKQWIDDKEQQDLKGVKKGGPGKAVPSKIKRLVMRLLYLRYRTSGASQVEANEELIAKFDLGPSSVAKITTSKQVDEHLTAG